MNEPTQDLIIESVPQTAWREFWHNPTLVIWSLICLAWIPFWIIFFNSWDIRIALAPALLYWGFVIRSFVNMIRGRMIAQFAASNGYEYSAAASLSPQDGAIFNVAGAHSKRFNHQVTGQMAGRPFKFLLYQYSTGQGKNRHDYTQSVMVIEFPSQLPHIVIDSKSFNSLNFDFARNQMVELEGDFRDYFTLYVPLKYEVEALDILSPDVMVQLIDKAKYFDVELINNRIYIYSKHYVDTRQKLLALHELVQTLVAELGKKLTGYRFTELHPTLKPVLKRGWAVGNAMNIALAFIVFSVMIVIILTSLVTGR